MSHRIDRLQQDKGIKRLINLLRYKEVYRQGLGILLVLVFALLAKPVYPWWQAGLALVVVGELIRLWAAGMVLKNRVLATSGPYGFVRHPLYVGNILVLLGMVVIAWQPYLLLVLIAFLWFFYPPAIRYEDIKLEELFGDDWRQWRAKVKALIPTLPSYPGAKTPWSFGLAAKKNGELGILVYIAACVVIALKF